MNLQFIPKNFVYGLAVALLCTGLCISADTVNSESPGELLKSRPQGSETFRLNGTFAIPGDDSLANSEARTMTVADIDGDGINDLLIGRQGSVSLQMGDINAFAPQTQEAWEAIRDLRFLSPFRREARIFPLPVSADYVVTGDFTRDGRVDILAAAAGGHELYLLEGDGKGNFAAPRTIAVEGSISALATGDVDHPDGLPDVVVAAAGDGLSNLYVYESIGDIFNAEPRVRQISGDIRTISVGQLDDNDFGDIAVSTPNEIVIFSGSEDKDSQPEPLRLPLSYGVRSVILGDFIPDRDYRSELAVLSDDGTVHILQRGELDTRPVTKYELWGMEAYEKMQKGMRIPKRIRNLIPKEFIRETPQKMALSRTSWTEADSFYGANPGALANSKAVLTSGKVADIAGDDLILLDPDSNQVVVMPIVFQQDLNQKYPQAVDYRGLRQTYSFNADTAPIAVTSGRFNFDTGKDLLILGQDGNVRTLVTAPQASFTVNSNGDAVDSNPGNGVCATAGAVCTLRAAIMEANRLSGADSIVINSGINITLNTGNPDDDSLGTNDHASGDLDISCTLTAGQDCTTPLGSNSSGLTITGAVGGNTISGGTFTADPNGGGATTDRIFDIGMDGIFGGGFGGSVKVDVSMSNLIIQNGNVREDNNTGTGAGNFARGGAIRYDGFGQSGTRATFSCTTCTFNGNQADHDTGGVFDQYASISYSGVTNTNNIGKAGPGGALQFLASTPATLTVSASSFTGNEARTGSVFSGTATDVDGGAIAANFDNNTGTITNTNFTNNISHDDGGALKAFNGAVTVTGGTMSGNSARDDGGAVWGDNDTVNVGRFLTLSGVVIQGNTANSDNSGGGDGGGIFRDRGTTNVTNCTVGGTGGGQLNVGVNGGGIAHAFRAAVTPSNVAAINIDNGSVSGNTATTTGGGIYYNDTNFGTAGTLVIGSTTSVTVNENNANLHGGGLAVLGGATDTLTRAAFNGNDADADNNASGDGGGLYHNNAGGTTTVASTVSFTNNGNGTTTTENGGAIHHSNGTLTLNTPTISGNDADVQGGGLFVSGGIVNVNGITFSGDTFPANAAEVRLTGGTTNFSGTVTIPGELSIAGGTLSAGSSTVNLGEDFHFSSGTFTAGTSSFDFGGAGTQQIYGGSVPTFNNLTVSNTSQPLNIQNNINVNGNLTVNANATSNPLAAIVVGGTGTLTGNGTIRVTKVSGTNDFLTQYTITNKTLTNLLVDYVGGSLQGFSGTTYGSARLNNSNGATLSGAAIINGTLTLQNGTFNVSTNTLTLNSVITGTGGGVLTSSPTGTVIYNQGSNGQAVYAGNYGNLTFSNFNKVLPTSTVGISGTFTPGSAGGHTVTGSNINFNGTTAQTVPVFPYEGLTIANSAGASLGGSVTVNGTLGLAAGTLAVGTNTLTLNGPATATAGTLSSAATGTVNYNQASNGQTVLAANYGNLTFSNFNKVLPAGTVGIASVFTTGSATGHTITGNTVNFNGAGAQTIPVFTYNNLTTSNAAKTLGGNVTANGDVTIGVGSSLILSGNVLTVKGNFTDNGTLNGSFAEAVNSPAAGGQVLFNGAANQTVGGTAVPTFNDLTINNAAGVTFNTTANVNGILTLTNGNVSMGANTLALGTTGTVSRTSGHVIGKIAKTFTGLGSFTYDVGTANGYSPVNVNVTAGTGTLTISAVQGLHPNVPDPMSAIARYWTLSGSGLTTELTFHYLQGDVIGDENTFNLIKINGGVVTDVYGPQFVTFDRTLNTALIHGIRSFSDWTLGTALPTAANASISGRVLAPNGTGVYRARVSITSSNGQTRSVRTGIMGNYQIDNVNVGETYTINVDDKAYRFTPRLVTVSDSISDLDFVGTP
ncbi:MAG: VCBS repeat-containing protein [Acidobacteria bacterium]|nr:VCBS repeat-containing protein [Acidobacteriota bacterium]